MYSLSLRVGSAGPPSLTVSPSAKVLANITTVSFLCEAQVIGVSTIYSFYKEGVIVQRGINNTLVYSTVSTSESGKYSCNAEVTGTVSASSNNIKLYVVGKCYMCLSLSSIYQTKISFYYSCKSVNIYFSNKCVNYVVFSFV